MPPQTHEPLLLTTASDCSERRSFRISPTSVPWRLSSLSTLHDCNDTAWPLMSHKTELCRVFDELYSRADKLEAMISEENVDNDGESPVLDACRFSLRSTLKTTLSQIGVGVESLKSRKEEPGYIMEQMQVTLAIIHAAQHLDMIELAFSGTNVLDQEFTSTLDALKKQPLPEHLRDNLCFSVSAWPTSSLAFNLPVGDLATTTAKGITVGLVPVLEIKADDALMGKSIHDDITACNIAIERCSHNALHFSAGSGTVGEASIRVRVSPMADVNDKAGTWGYGAEVEKICVKEARAVQLNAYPPKSRQSVDLYTSYSYGEASVTITLVVKTYQTKNGEDPNLHIQLILAPTMSL